MSIQSFRAVLLASMVTAAGCATRVPAGRFGLYVYASSGVGHEVLGPGLHWHMPWTHVLTFPGQWYEYEETIDVLTADDVHLSVKVGMALRPNVRELYELQRDFGATFYETFAESAFFTSTRTVLAHYNMVDLPENSEKIEAEIRAHVDERIRGNHLELGRIALQHIDYPPSVQAAIEQRLVVQQHETQKAAEIKIAQENAEISKINADSAAANALIAARGDAEAARIRAEGESKAQDMLGKTLTPLLVQMRALTSPASKLVFVPEGRQLSVVLGADGATAAAAK